MTEITSDQIITPALEYGAIINNRFPGFLLDYKVIHCLIRKYKPQSIFEFGCNTGFGTKIICNAAGVGCDVFSFDLPTEECHISLQHPISENKGDVVGKECDLPFTLVRGNSYTYDFSELGEFDLTFVDSEHNYEIPLIEAKASIEMNAKTIIFHDSDLEPVYKAITDAFQDNNDYELYRVIDTRISYAIKNKT